MGSRLAKFLLLMFTAAVFAAYTWLLPAPWPHMLTWACGDVVGSEVCRATFTWYFWLYAGFCLGYMWLAIKTSELLRPTLLLVLALGLFVAVQPFTFHELNQIQTYSYEVFIVGFYNWMAWMAMAFAACLMWPKQQVHILRGMAALTLVMTAVFAFKGRGSTEHINPIAGGLLVERSLAMAKEGMLIRLCLAILAAGIVVVPLRMIAQWVARGKVDLSVGKRQLKLTGLFLGVALLPVLSLPVGIWLNGRDVQEARAYVNTFVPALEAYHKEHKEYPDVLGKIGAKLEDVPRLLAIYDYIAYGTKGGFYLARPEKFCFIFPNPGQDFGYWSLTSMRPWRLSKPEGSLEESYETVCDEDQEDVQQALIAGHLGIPDANDPLTALGVEAGERFPMKRQTQAVTPRLQQAIDELGYKDPSIYYQPPAPPAGSVVTPESLLEELKKQPLRTD